MNTADPQSPGYRFEASMPTLAPASQEEGAGPGPRTFSGVAYSGDVMVDCGERIVIDLDTLVPTPVLPGLLQHDRSQRVAVATLTVSAGTLLAQGRMLSNPTAAALIADADEGFPLQMSVHAVHGAAEGVMSGASVQINGRELAGPLTILRQTRIRELSFTPTGVDPNTSARVLSEPPPAGVRGEESGVRSAEPLTPHPSPLTPHPSPLTPHPSPLTPHPSPITHEALPMTTASNDPGQPALAALEARLAATETALASERADRRRAEVTSLFASAGRPAPDEARMNHYLSLSPEQWSAVAADLHLPRAAAPDHLFSEQATDGLAKDRQQADDALVARMAALN